MHCKTTRQKQKFVTESKNLADALYGPQHLQYCKIKTFCFARQAVNNTQLIRIFSSIIHHPSNSIFMFCFNVTVKIE